MLAATVVTVLVALLATALGAEVVAHTLRHDSPGAAALTVGIVGAPVALLAGLLGCALALALRKLGRLTQVPVIAVGTALGLAVAVWDPFFSFSSGLLQAWVVGVGAGAGAVWWRVYSTHQPSGS